MVPVQTLIEIPLNEIVLFFFTVFAINSLIQGKIQIKTNTAKQTHSF